MTVHDARTCEPTLEAWENMILKEITKSNPKASEQDIRSAVRATLLSIHMRQPSKQELSGMISN
jgi:hypothetical protein